MADARDRRHRALDRLSDGPVDHRVRRVPPRTCRCLDGGHGCPGRCRSPRTGLDAVTDVMSWRREQMRRSAVLAAIPAAIGVVLVGAAMVWRRHRRTGTGFVNAVVNPALVRRGLAGSGGSEIGTLEHIGRRSGVRRLTPVHPEPTANGFRIVVPLGRVRVGRRSGSRSLSVLGGPALSPRRTPVLRPVCSSVPISDPPVPARPDRTSAGFTTAFTKPVPVRGCRRHIVATTTMATPIAAGAAAPIAALRICSLLPTIRSVAPSTRVRGRRPRSGRPCGASRHRLVPGGTRRTR